MIPNVIMNIMTKTNNDNITSSNNNGCTYKIVNINYTNANNNNGNCTSEHKFYNYNNNGQC